MTHQQDSLRGLLVTNFHAQIWVMRFFILYCQTIEFTGVYQRWTTHALMPKSMSEMHFRTNSKKIQSLGKNSCRQKCLDKRLQIQLLADLQLIEKT